MRSVSIVTPLSACGPGDAMRAATLTADIAEAEAELSRSRDVLQRRLTAKGHSKEAEAAAKAAARKKQRTS